MVLAEYKNTGTHCERLKYQKVLGIFADTPPTLRKKIVGMIEDGCFRMVRGIRVCAVVKQQQ